MALPRFFSSLLVEEVAELRVRWRPPQLQAECLGQGAVVGDGKALKIPQALASTQDFEHGHQQQVPGGKAHAAAHRASGIDLR